MGTRQRKGDGERQNGVIYFATENSSPRLTSFIDVFSGDNAWKLRSYFPDTSMFEGDMFVQ